MLHLVEGSITIDVAVLAESLQVWELGVFCGTYQTEGIGSLEQKIERTARNPDCGCVVLEKAEHFDCCFLNRPEK